MPLPHQRQYIRVCTVCLFLCGDVTLIVIRLNTELVDGRRLREFQVSNFHNDQM